MSIKPKATSVAMTVAGRDFVPFSDDIKPTSWAIKGVIPEGVGVISGTGGVGKSSCIVPLALSVAGITAPGSDLEISRQRRVIYVTEDQPQIEAILHGMRHFLEWSDDVWQKVKTNFLVLDSVRMDYQLLKELLEGMTSNDFDLEVPLLVIDTASANLEISNESDNSEVSRMMAVIKQFAAMHARLASIWIVTHLSKGAKGQSIDEIRKFGARGAGAWEDNAQWSALIASTKEDNEGHRIFKMCKRRCVLDFDEISFKGHEGVMTNKDGLEVRYRYTVGNKASAYLRKQEYAIERSEEYLERFKKAFDACLLPFPSKSDICALTTGKRTEKMTRFDEYVAKGFIVEVPIPDEGTNRELLRRKTYFRLS